MNERTFKEKLLANLEEAGFYVDAFERSDANPSKIREIALARIDYIENTPQDIEYICEMAKKYITQNATQLLRDETNVPYLEQQYNFPLLSNQRWKWPEVKENGEVTINYKTNEIFAYIIKPEVDNFIKVVKNDVKNVTF